MFTLERRTTLPARREDVFAFFSDPQNLSRITPPSLGFEIVEAPSRSLRAGDRIRYRIRLLGLPVTWVTLISEWDERNRFVDEQERGPYRRWHHEHLFMDEGGGTLMVDRVEYDLPFGRPGALFGGWWVRRSLRAIFDYRAKAIRTMFPAGVA